MLNWSRNPDIRKLEKYDHILSKKGLREAGKNYAGNLDITDYRVSPNHGDFSGLSRITIFAGTNDLLLADARKCVHLLDKQTIVYNYFEYEKMMHDWVIITSLKEAQDAINKVSTIINPKL